MTNNEPSDSRGDNCEEQSDRFSEYEKPWVQTMLEVVPEYVAKERNPSYRYHTVQAILIIVGMGAMAAARADPLSMSLCAALLGGNLLLSRNTAKH